MRWLSSWPLGLAGFLGLNAWTVWGFFQSPFQLIAGLELRWPFFVLLACVGFPMTAVMGVGVVRERIAPMLPSRRFHSLTDEIRNVRGNVERFSMSDGWLFDEVSTLRAKMARLKIKTPLIDLEDRDCQRDWVRWLAYMAPLAETWNIRAAREWKLGDQLPNVETDHSAVVL